MRTGGWVYPPGMTPEPALPPSPGFDPGPEPGSGEQSQSGNPPPSERYGPIAIARHVKEDGRALLLYTHTSAREPG